MSGARYRDDHSRRDTSTAQPAGAEKAWLQGLLVTGMSVYLWCFRRCLGLSAWQVPAYLKDLLTLAAGPSELKYVQLGRHVFADGWAPPIPSEGFFRAVTGFPNFVNAENPTEACAYAVLSLTSCCVYRCEHCYTFHTLAGQDQVPEGVVVTANRRWRSSGWIASEKWI